MQRIRDETHATAVGFHRQRRDAATLRTELMSLPGIGEKLAERLLGRFGSLERLRAASLQELEEALGPHRAQKLYAYLRER